MLLELKQIDFIENKRIFFTIFVIVSIFCLIEGIVSIIPDFITDFITSSSGIFLFSIMVMLSLSFYYFYKKILVVNKEILKTNRLMKIIDKSVLISGAILVGLSFVTLVNILFFSYYHKSTLVLFTILANFESSVIFGVFSFKFLQWFKNDRHSYVVLLFTLAFGILFFNNIFAGLGDSYQIITHKSEIVDASTEIKFYDFEEGSFFNLFYDVYSYLENSMFIFFYIATIKMLYSFVNKFGKIKFWVIMVLPLVGQLSTSLDSFNIIQADTDASLFFYYIAMSVISAVVGILFAFVFWKIAKQIGEDNPIGNYLKIVAFGFVLFYFTNQVSVFVITYPPFGILNLTLLPIATYLVGIGLYSSAISISQNLNLRKSLKKLTLSDANFLSSIGKGEMENTVKQTVDDLKKVVNEQEKEMEEKSGIETQLSTTEMEDYLQQVLEETLKMRNKKKSSV